MKEDCKRSYGRNWSKRWSDNSDDPEISKPLYRDTRNKYAYANPRHPVKIHFPNGGKVNFFCEGSPEAN
ncbi:hypothetical protein ACFLZZ_04465 [Nanoarchaeota archaeon]